jgi:hypothetical protein
MVTRIVFGASRNTNAATAIDATAPKAADLMNGATCAFTSNPSRSCPPSTALCSQTPPVRPAHLRLQHFPLRPHQQPHLPPELMGRRTGVLGGDSSEHEQLSEFPWVPVQ